MIKAIALVDCNAFYCSCERLFRPDLANRPIVVLSNNDGCAISRTSEAKALGVKMGEPFFKFKPLVNNAGLHVFSSNFSLYTDISRRVMKVLAREAPGIEVYSVDEAFLDLSGIKNTHTFGMHLKQAVEREVGIPVGVGIGPTKVLAKVANHLAKKSLKAQGVVCLMEKKWHEAALARTPVSDLWGVGSASLAKLLEMGVKNALQFRDYPNTMKLQKKLTIRGVQIQQELLGTICFPVGDPPPEKKEIRCSRTFATEIYSLDDLQRALCNYVSYAAEKMRKQKSLCQEVSIFASTNFHAKKPQFYLHESAPLVTATLDTRKLILVVMRLLGAHFRQGFGYKKAGVTLSNFYASSEFQPDLFHPSDDPSTQALMQTVDSINYFEGEGTVKSLACLQSHASDPADGSEDLPWRMNRNFKSPAYTTRWTELPRFA